MTLVLQAVVNGLEMGLVYALVFGLGFVLCLLAGGLTFGANLARLTGEPREWGAKFDFGLGEQCLSKIV